MSVLHRSRVPGPLPQTAGPWRHEQGIALVVVLLVVALVTVLVLEYHFDAAVELDLAVNFASDVQAYYLALAGLDLAQALLQADTTRTSDGPEDLWHEAKLKLLGCLAPQQLLELAASLGSTAAGGAGSAAGTGSDLGALGGPDQAVLQGATGCVALRITDEERKLPVHALRPPAAGTPPGTTPQPPADWVAIFTHLGLQPDQVAALVDWIDEDEDLRPNGAESSYYQQLKPPYKSRNGPLRMPGELRLVKDFNTTETLSLLLGKHVEPTSHVDLGSPEALLTPFPGSQPQRARAQETKVNLNTVDALATEPSTAVVLRAIIGGLLESTGGGNPDQIVEDILTKRQSLFQAGKQFHKMSEVTDLLSGNATFKSKLTQVADVKSAYFRVESEGRVGQDVRDLTRKRIVTVVQRSSEAAGAAGAGGGQHPTPQFKRVYFKVE